MSIGSYTDKSDSIQKNLTRKAAYDTLTRPQLDRCHIVIVGYLEDRLEPFQCGDIAELLGRGVAANHIIVCGGLDSKGRQGYMLYGDNLNIERLTAGEWAEREFGCIASPYPFIQDCVKWAVAQGLKLGSVNADLCSGLRFAIPVVKSILKATDCPVFLTSCRNRDGLGNEENRQKWLKEHISLAPDKQKKYQSKTENSKGSPMLVSIWKRRYKCSRCGQVDKHPAIHGKVCR
jgi:hypothetical protein